MLAAWSWMRVLTALWIGYFGLLRPGEICDLRGGDTLIVHHGLLVKIKRPKRRAGGARQEYSRLDHQDCHPFVLKFLAKLPTGHRLWPCSPKALGLRFQCALERLVPQPGRFNARIAPLRRGDHAVPALV